MGFDFTTLNRLYFFVCCDMFENLNNLFFWFIFGDVYIGNSLFWISVAYIRKKLIQSKELQAMD